MKDLRWFLISRLIIILVPVVLTEQLLFLFLRGLVFPYIILILNSGTDMAGETGFGELLIMLGNMFRQGAGEQAVEGLSRGFAGLILFVLTVLVWLLPIACGILIYAVQVEKKVKAIEEAREEEHRQFELKRNLMLSDFAHDLRTPVMTVSGYARALSDGLVKEEDTKREYLSIIVRKSDRLAELINMLFEYAKLDSSGFSLEKSRFDVHVMLKEVTASYYLDLEEAGMIPEIDIPEQAFFVNADRAQLSRIFENLLKNAMIHNPKGTKIFIGIKKIPGGEDLCVADNGTAIEKSEEELFSPFVRGDASRSGGSGSGLGLSISKKIADMHGYDFSLREPFGSYTKAFVLRIIELAEKQPESGHDVAP